MASRARLSGRATLVALPNLRIRLFGQVSVEIDGKPFALATPRKTLPILGYLLVNRDAPVAREFLAYLFWPDDTEESARSKLRANLYDLARLFSAATAFPLVIADTDTVRWNPEARLWLDVDEFQVASRDPRRLEEAVTLYRGELLEAVYEDWIFPLRERLRNLYLADLEQLVSEYRRARDFPRAIAHAQRLLEVDPWREDMLRRLMATRHAAGDRAGAFAEFQRFASRLRTELGIEPMPESVALRDAIARGATLAEQHSEVHSEIPAGGQSDLPFVGRRSEMEQLLEAWSRAARGRGTCVFLGGEAGVGKSRLAIELAHAVEERGGHVVVGATGSPEVTPYQSLIEALRSVLPILASARIADVWLTSVAAVLPELYERFQSLPKTLPKIDAQNERVRFFESLARCFSAVAQVRPILIILEDLHWAGEATIAALEFLLRRLSSQRIMIVMTYREDETPRMHPLRRLRRDTKSEGMARSLTLRPLTLAEVAEMIEAMPALSINSAELHASSDGNPLFVSLLLHAAEGTVAAAGTDGVRSLIRRRIERLSAEARSIAEIASLIGSRFPREVVADVSGWSEAAVDEAFDELMEHRVVRETSGRGFFDCCFSHHLVAEVVAGEAEPRRAATRHRRIARVLEDLGTAAGRDLLSIIARQYDLAGDAAKAARRYLAAAERGLSLGALDEAGELLMRGLELATEPRLRADILLARETLMQRRAADDVRVRVLSELDDVASALDEDELRRTIALRRITFAQERNDRAEEEKALATLRRLARTTTDERWRGRLKEAEARRAIDLGRFEEARRAAQAALASYISTQDGAGEAEARYLLAEIEMHHGDLARAESLFDEARGCAERMPNAQLSIRSLTALYNLTYQQRDMERCLEFSRCCLETAVRAGDRRAEAEGHRQCAMALIPSARDLSSSREYLAAAAAIFNDIGDADGRDKVEINRALLQRIVGNFQAARSTYERVLDGYASHDHPRRRLAVLLSLSETLAFLGDASQAYDRAAEAAELAQRFGYSDLETWCLEGLALALAHKRDYGLAIERMEEALARRVGTGSERWSSLNLANLAKWYAAAGNVTKAREYAARMLEDERSIAVAATWPQTLYWIGAQVFRLSGEHDAATKALARAHQLLCDAAQHLSDEDKATFLSIMWHRDMMAAVERDVWPDPPR